MTESYSARIKAELCKKSAEEAGILRGTSEPASDCCRLVFFSALCAFGAKQTPQTLRFSAKSEELSDLFASFAAAFYSLSPIVRDGKVELKNDAALARVLRAAGLNEADNCALPLPVCGTCLSHLLRAAFLMCGTMADPKKSHQLCLFTDRFTPTLAALCREQDLPFRTSKRRQKPYLYLKSASDIEDFLTFLGAEKIAMELMDDEMQRGVRAFINRQNNFDTANLSRSTAFLIKLDEAIVSLKESGRDADLADNLKHLIRLRELYPEDSLNELGERMAPKLSKSGLYHRARRIIDLSQNKEV